MQNPKLTRGPVPRRLLWGILLTACGIAWAVPAASFPGRYETLRAQDLRVASVAYRLSLANRANCSGTLVPQLGMVIHSLGQYGAADRDAAARSFKLGRHVSVMAVVDGSPAAKAGLRADDRLLAVNGRELNADAPSIAGPGRAALGGIERIILQEMKKGPIVFRVSSQRGDHQVGFEADSGCPANVELAPGELVNAWADGTGVVVSAGILQRCPTDDDLALVIAHELAHNLLAHKDRLAKSRSAYGERLMPSARESAMMRQIEEEADRLAVRLAKAAGFDLRATEPFLTGLVEADRPVEPATHPTLARRIALLKMEIAAADTDR
jgi:hypothetical protein